MQIRKSFKNIIFGFLSQIISIILGVIIPRLFIHSFGSEMNGFISSIGQVFVYLSLFEAGIGTATLVALYGPTAKREKSAINSIMSATNIYQKKAAVYYICALAAFAFGYPFVVQTNISYPVVVAVILMTGFSGFNNFFVYGKYYLMMQAEGRGYVISNINVVVMILMNVTRIALLAGGFDIITVQSTYVVFNIILMLSIKIYIRWKYKWVDVRVKPDFSAVSTKNYVLLHQTAKLVFQNTDMITLSVFANLKIVSVYALYTILFGMIGTAIETVAGGFTFSLGQLFNTDKDKYLKMNHMFEFYYLAVVFTAYTVAFVFILPFLQLYTAGISDITYIDRYLPILFVSIYFLSNAQMTSNLAVSFAGHFKQTRWIVLIEAVVNLSISLILVNLIGIYGVLVATIIALLFRTNAMIVYAGKHILGKNVWITYRRWLINLCVFIAIFFTTRWLTFTLSSYVAIFLWAAGCCVVAFLLFAGVGLLVEKDVRRASLQLIKPYISRKFRKPA